MSDYNVYIDEAGDLGIGRGTRWFVLSAVIVAKEDESAIREKMGQIKNRLNVREIHLRKISEFPKRAFIVRELSSQNYTYINILVDTTKFDKAKIPDPLKAYIMFVNICWSGCHCFWKNGEKLRTLCYRRVELQEMAI